jgi:hypothetical protein
MSKEILRSTVVTVGSLMFVVGSLMFLIFSDDPLGRRASILLLGGGVFALVAGLISQITDQQSFAPLGRRIVNSYKAAALVILILSFYLLAWKWQLPSWPKSERACNSQSQR